MEKLIGELLLLVVELVSDPVVLLAVLAVLAALPFRILLPPLLLHHVHLRLCLRLLDGRYAKLLSFAQLLDVRDSGS